MKPIHWRRGRLGRYLRHLPRAKNIRGTWLHRRLGDRLFAPELWHPTRQRFAAGVSVGAFFALLPAPFQMLAAGIIAYITRVNVPAAIAATWISNPFTFPFFVYVQYRLVCFLIGRNPSNVPTHDVLEMLSKVPVPFLIGALPAATILAIAVYPMTLIIWDWSTKHIHQRHGSTTGPRD